MKRARKEIQLPPPIPADLAQLRIPPNFQIYKRTEELEEQYLLADSDIFFEGVQQNGRQHRFPNNITIYFKFVSKFLNDIFELMYVWRCCVNGDKAKIINFDITEY